MSLMRESSMHTFKGEALPTVQLIIKDALLQIKEFIVRTGCEGLNVRQTTQNLLFLPKTFGNRYNKCNISSKKKSYYIAFKECYISSNRTCITALVKNQHAGHIVFDMNTITQIFGVSTFDFSIHQIMHKCFQH